MGTKSNSSRSSLVKEIPLEIALNRFFYHIMKKAEDSVEVITDPEGWVVVNLTKSLSILPPEAKCWDVHFRELLQAQPQHPDFALLGTLMYLVVTSERIHLVSGEHTQMWSFGKPQPKHNSLKPSAHKPFQIKAKVDEELVGCTVNEYPFKIRAQELAAFHPKKEIFFRYMSFPPMSFISNEGLADLLSVIQVDPPVQASISLHREHLKAVLAYSPGEEMEKLKIFVEGHEVFNHWLEDRVRKRWEQAEVSTPRRQTLENIKAGRRSYFGVYSLTQNWLEDEDSELEIQVMPGLIGVIDIDRYITEEDVQALEEATRNLALQVWTEET